ncbi:hypothetical protein [Nocardia jiangxiensis]|uniref:hypothetical protein n=1 Tax=Nocardia jiangxiensis TaxID=282685 RepID=UPI0002DB5725|nr:hypothetical protein [Nocardia jiangxiensis]
MSDLAEDYRRHGFAARLGAGEHPAVLVVDICAAYLTVWPPRSTPPPNAPESPRPHSRSSSSSSVIRPGARRSNTSLTACTPAIRARGRICVA